VDPVYVYADIDEDTLLKFNALAHSGKIETNNSGQTPIELQLADEKDFPHQGYVESSTPARPQHRQHSFAGVFPNGDGRIVPGLFARIRLPLSERHPVLLVADSAIGTDQAQKYVLALTATNTVEYRSVQLGPVVEGRRIVRSGLQAGDKIIVNGLQRARPGMPVTPQQEVAHADNVKVANR